MDVFLHLLFIIIIISDSLLILQQHKKKVRRHVHHSSDVHYAVDHDVDACRDVDRLFVGNAIITLRSDVSFALILHEFCNIFSLYCRDIAKNS
jgi:hypothetical protein